MLRNCQRKKRITPIQYFLSIALDLNPKNMMVSHVELRKSSVIIRIVRVGLTCSENRVRGGSTRSRIQKQSMMWDPHAKEWQYAPGNRTVPDTCFDRARVSHFLFCTNKVVPAHSSCLSIVTYLLV